MRIRKAVYEVFRRSPSCLSILQPSSTLATGPPLQEGSLSCPRQRARYLSGLPRFAATGVCMCMHSCSRVYVCKNPRAIFFECEFFFGARRGTILHRSSNGNFYGRYCPCFFNRIGRSGAASLLERIRGGRPCVDVSQTWNFILPMSKLLAGVIICF